MIQPSVGVLLFATLATSVHAQLRPRRVGTNAMGEQQEVPVAGSGGAAAGMEGLEAMAAALGGAGGGEGGFDPAALLQGMDLSNNPMLQGLAESNPEIAQMLSNPDALKEQMGQMMKMFSSPEGQAMAKNLMSEMQSVLTDKDKLKSGLEQLGSNPALRGIADAVPGLREVLDDPDQLDSQAEKAAEMFQSMQDPDKVQEMLAAMGGGAGSEGQEAIMQKMQEAMSMLATPEGLAEAQESLQRMGELLGGQGDGEDSLSDLFEATGAGAGSGDGDALKARVREQLASMLSERRGGGGGLAAADLDEEF